MMEAMPDEPRSQALDAALLRRDELLQAIGRLEAILASPAARSAWLDDVRGSIKGLRDAFAIHVSVTEGEEALFEEIVDAAPRLANQVDALRRDHTEIDAAIQDAMHAVEDSDTPDPAVVRTKLTGVLGHLVRHRQQGADLLYEAYQVDVGGVD